ncbi:hypothetical protein BC628DRAFT_1393476 [Trametes gibbosa]|nr:hypothetical protein BC628DRAFT_1393476 [Trametes gibbosa]
MARTAIILGTPSAALAGGAHWDCSPSDHLMSCVGPAPSHGRYTPIILPTSIREDIQPRADSAPLMQPHGRAAPRSLA